MKQNQIRLGMVIIGGMLLVSPCTVLAKGPGAEAAPPKYSEEILGKLQDNTIEYSEIPILVREYNPTISQMWDSYQDSKEDYENLVLEMESRYLDVKDLADNYISMGQTLGNQELIMAGKSLDSTYKGTLKSMKNTVNKWDNNKRNTSTMTRYERQMVSGVQSALIGYDSIRKNLPTLETMVQLYERQYDLAKRQETLGLGTRTAVLAAGKEVLGAKAQYIALQSNEDSTRRTIQMLIGRSPEEQLDIPPIPPFEIERIGTMNLEQDTKKAIGNNITLIDQRNSRAGGTSTQIENRMKIIEDGDQRLTIEMERLYQDVKMKEAAYKAAVVGFDGATASKGSADRQYQLGYLSETQYVGTQIAYYQKKGALESADLSLRQAMETYEWAILGFATVE